MATLNTGKIGQTINSLFIKDIERDYMAKRTYYICDCLACGNKDVRLYKDNVEKGRSTTCGCGQGKRNDTKAVQNGNKMQNNKNQ